MVLVLKRDRHLNDEQMTNQIICMMGPTASGKSQLAMKLSAQYPFEIISVDSVQVYRGLDIGSAKPSLEDRKTIPHHLIDIRDPWEFYSCGDFYEDVKNKKEEMEGMFKLA